MLAASSTLGASAAILNARMNSGELVLDVEGDVLLADSAVKMTHATVTCGYHVLQTSDYIKRLLILRRLR